MPRPRTICALLHLKPATLNRGEVPIWEIVLITLLVFSRALLTSLPSCVSLTLSCFLNRVVCASVPVFHSVEASEDDGLRVHSGRAPGRGSGFTVSDVRRVGLSSLGLFGKQSLLELKGLFLKERSAGVQLQPSETRTGLMTLPLKL